mmetsp:Transcript_18104/g.29368  ORF Transcript_18104/g.29368 Transcript_18104/m.29368 type:complete len:360 (+) Transcript_18104:216-1295(+)
MSIQCLGFNQDGSCFMVGTDSGFATFNTEPFAEGTRRNFENGGVGVVELLYRSNILALVGGGSCPQWPVNKVMLWDDTKRKCVGELSFHTAVKGVLLRKDIIVVVLEKRIYFYNFVDLHNKYSFETINNPKGLCALSLEPVNRVFAYPAEQKGTIKLELLGENEVNKTILIPAHESELVALSLNRDGSLVASASERGTLIRVFCTNTGELRYELRRGADRAIIYSLSFNANSTLIACTSDKCTVHIFRINSGEGEQDNPLDTQAGGAGSSKILEMGSRMQNMLKGNIGEYLPKYFTTDTIRSAVRFPVPETYTVSTFGSKPSTILVGGMDGSFSQYAFDLRSGAHERTFYGSVFSNKEV